MADALPATPCSSAKRACRLVLACAAFRLSAGNRPDIWNVPANAGKRLHHCDDPDYEERDMDERGDDCPEKYQDSTDARNSAEDSVHYGRDNVKKQPRAAKDDRLHGVKTDKAVAFFENVKNDASD